MKVGIMSMQRVVNYGSFLQAYSLKKNIEALDGEVEFVDYRVEAPLVKQECIRKSTTKKYLDKVTSRVIPPVKLAKGLMQSYWDEYIKMDSHYEDVMLPMLGIKKERNYTPELDLLVIGSDEVFNCLQPNPNVGYSKELFGANNHSKKVISYAASFGNTTKEGLMKYGIYDEIKELMNQFAGISVRDKNSYGIIEEMVNKKMIQNVDPVFLYDYTKEMDIEVPIRDYIVVYAYANRISKKEAAAIKKFAKKNNKSIVCLCAPQEYLEGYLPLNPFEVLAYVKNADYVITDTFHGSVFSIKFNKNFATFIRGGYESQYGNNKKLYDLLATFGLTERSVDELKQLEDILSVDPEYELVNKKIEQERKKSIEYLAEFIY